MEYEGSVILFYWQYSLLSKGRMTVSMSIGYRVPMTVANPCQRLLLIALLRWYGIINAMEKTWTQLRLFVYSA